MAETFVLDSYAILALLGGEPGGEEVARLMRRAEAEDASLMMTWVNAGEVSYIVERRWGRDRLLQVLAVLEATALKMVPVERELALAGARIKAVKALAYADALAAALAISTDATLVTGDPEFHLLEEMMSIRWLGADT